MLKYLARYTHRVAISNRRLVALEGDEVEFRWRDYARKGGPKTMRLEAVEFIRRFLLHVLPSGFVRIRHYGFLANRVRREKLARCRALLDGAPAPEPVTAPDPSAEPRATSEGPVVARACPCCGRGRMVVVATVPATRTARRELGREPALGPCAWDTS